MREVVINFGVNVQNLGTRIESGILQAKIRVVVAIGGEGSAAERLTEFYRFGDEDSRIMAVRAVVGVLTRSKTRGLSVEQLLTVFKQGLNDSSEEVEKTLLETYFSALEKSQQANQAWPGNLPTVGWVWYRLQNKELMKPYQRLGRK